MMSAVVSKVCGGALIAGGILCWLVACAGDSNAGPPMVRTGEVCQRATDCKAQPDDVCKDAKTLVRYETPACGGDKRCLWNGTEDPCGGSCQDGFCVSAR
jgi:hypothetical protein